MTERMGGDRYAAAFDAVLAWMEREQFRGWDPYDGSNTGSAWLRRVPSLAMGLTYLHKFSPVNLRPLLGVRRSTSVYALALVSSALVRAGRAVEHRALLARHEDTFAAASLAGRWGEHCWSGTGLWIQARGILHTPDVPGVVGTEAVAAALIDVDGHLPGTRERHEMLRSVRRFCLDRLYREHGGHAWFSYKPTTSPTHVTYNASMKGAVLVMHVNAHLGEDEGADRVARVLEFLLARQRPDGAWAYSEDLRDGRVKTQIDFHQGFMLDGLMTWLELRGADPRVAEALSRGLEFYRDRQFTGDGQGHYRWPRRWPANIHNQAQAIVTFRRAASLFPEHDAFARRVADWTLDHMYGPAGIFHYLRYPFFSNRIPYFRWNQAWMLYALAHLLAPAGAPSLPRTSPP